MSVSCECRVLSGRGRADHLSRGVLASVVCTVSVITKPIHRNQVEVLQKKNLVFVRTEGSGKNFRQCIL